MDSLPFISGQQTDPHHSSAFCVWHPNLHLSFFAWPSSGAHPVTDGGRRFRHWNWSWRSWDFHSATLRSLRRNQHWRLLRATPMKRNARLHFWESGQRSTAALCSGNLWKKFSLGSYTHTYILLCLCISLFVYDNDTVCILWCCCTVKFALQIFAH